MSLTTIASTSLGEGMRGGLNKWMLEVGAGVFVGVVSARVRDALWAEMATWIGSNPDPSAYAVMIFATNNEQGFSMRTAGQNRYEVEDFDGISLVSRRVSPTPARTGGGLPDPSW